MKGEVLVIIKKRFGYLVRQHYIPDISNSTDVIANFVNRQGGALCLRYFHQRIIEDLYKAK